MDTLEMQLRLLTGAKKTFCNASKRDKNGRQVAECSFHPGHENDHRDVHNGATWK